MMAQREAPPGATAPTPPLNTWQCWRCGRVLARLFLLAGCRVEIKCKGCGALNVAAIDNGKATPYP